MVSAFESDSSAYYAHDGASARMYADQGHAYKAESQACVTERRQLVAKIRTAREQFEAVRPAFQRAKSEYTQARQEFLSAKAEHERAQAEFNKAKAEFDDCAKAFKDRLDELKSAHRKRRKEKSRSLKRLEFRLNIETTSGFRKIQMATPISTSVGLVSLMVLVMGTTLWISMEPWHIGAIRLTRMVRRTSPMHLVEYYLYDRRARTNTLPLGVRNRDNDTNDRSGVFYDRRRQIDLQVTQYYKDNCRVSWDTKGKSDENYHWTDQNFPSGHPESHIPPEDAR